MEARVVIGANFGDEGKGLMTDYHVVALGGSDVVVCRFNGGAQAGHTVVTPEGRRHVFSHFGSGTLQGAETFLGQHFIVNPLLWRKELSQLAAINSTAPLVVVDPRALLSTPFDMLVNQAAEEARGSARHGSCGVGINETVTRCESGGQFSTLFEDVKHPLILRARLELIRERYLPMRLDKLGISDTDGPAMHLLSDSDGLIDQYMEAVGAMRRSVTIADSEYLCGRQVIFEGAQGLLLDQHHRYFPHVTRSSTGLTNVLEIAEEAGISGLDVTYVTRSYVTRHGAGPLETEDASMSFYDDTNVQGPWQGQLRFGELDADLLVETIKRDLDRVTDVDLTCSLAVTHLDQHKTRVYPSEVALMIGADHIYYAYGPTREHVGVSRA